MSNQTIYPVLLGGGSGTRLWPLSRELYPKQFLALNGGQTLVQETLLRLKGLDNLAAPVVVCQEPHRFIVAEQLREINFKPLSIVLEPQGKNTAPAITLAALQISQLDPQGLMLVLPSDHMIEEKERLQQSILEAKPLAQEGQLVTFGIVPTKPETGYGYIRKGMGNQVSHFIEKPDLQTASDYVRSGEYLWNSGMFLWSVEHFLHELERYQPEILSVCRKSLEEGQTDGIFQRLNDAYFAQCPSISVDYGVMEQTRHAAVIPLPVTWSDIGSWNSWQDYHATDERGNVQVGDVVLYNSDNSLVHSTSRLVTTLGIQDLMVIETADAVMVGHRSQAQQLRALVGELKSQQRSEVLHHRKVHRPWGSYETLDQGTRFLVKRITVRPGEALSMQLHHHRAEHWIVVKGTAQVTCGESTFLLTENQSTFIPLGVKHRLENPGLAELELIEVQSGSYLSEADIVRFDDRYCRT